MIPTAAFLAILAAGAPVWALCAAGFVTSACLTSGDIVWMTTFQRLVPEHLISRLSSIDWLGSVALNPLGYALVGPVSARLGVAETIFVAAAVNGGVSVTVALVPSIRNLRAGAQA
jgi:hypothetical protein